VQAAVAAYDTHHAALRSAGPDALGDGGADTDAGGGAGEGKEASNLLVLLTALYALQLVSCVLLYDLVRDLLAAPEGANAATQPVMEADVELLLKVLRSACAFITLHPRYAQVSRLRALLTRRVQTPARSCARTTRARSRTSCCSCRRALKGTRTRSGAPPLVPFSASR
jgi:hypothetical protein